jgi:hypothetical protein
MNPQVALMVITTHGIIRSCTLSSREVVAIPPGLNVMGIQAIPPGLINILGNNEFGFMKDVIKNFTKLTRMIKKKRRSLDVDELVKEYAFKMKEEMTEEIKKIQETYHGTDYSHLGSISRDIRDFTISSHLCNIYDYNEKPLIEKEFVVSSDDTSPEDHEYNWKINLFLQDGSVVDLMDECFMTRATRRKEEGVKLSFLLDCLRRKYSITNLIILDLSCNTMDSDDFYIKNKKGKILRENDVPIEDPRAVRTFRRSFMKDIFKGKTRKKIKKIKKR